MASKLKIFPAPRSKSVANVGKSNGGHVYWVKKTTALDYATFYDRHFIKYNNGKSSIYNSLDAAIAACTASVGDVIYVSEGYTETITAAKSIATAGIAIIGLGIGLSRPTLTVNAAVDGISLDAANILFENFHFAAPATDAATAMINVTKAGCSIRDITGIGSGGSENFVDCITIATGADDLTIDGVSFRNTTVAVNSFLSIEAAVARLTIKNFFAFGDVATAGIIDGATATQILLQDVVVGTVGTTKPAATLDSNPTGMAVRCSFAGTSTTLADNAALGTGLRLFDVKVLEETDGSAQGALIPAVDAN